MEFDLQKIKKLDDKTQYLVFGYIRLMESLFLNNNKTNAAINIPDLMIYTIMAFYAHLERFEHFEKNSFDVTNDGTKIIKIDHAQRTLYGSTIMAYESKGIYEWRIKILKGTYIAIGIDEACYKWMKDATFFFAKETLNYAYAMATGKKCSQNNRDGFLKRCFMEDIVTMVVNMNNKIISFAKNDDELKKAYDIMESKIGYCLAVYMIRKGDSVELLSYRHTY